VGEARRSRRRVSSLSRKTGPNQTEGGCVRTLRDYECVYIVDPLVNDEELEAIISRYRQVVADHGGEVLQAGKWEKRRLAYEINGRREGTYILMNFKSGPEAAAELERVLRLSEQVLRHIVVRQEPGKSLYINLEKLAEVGEAETAEPAAEVMAAEEVPAEQMPDTEGETPEEEEIEADSGVEAEAVPLPKGDPEEAAEASAEDEEPVVEEEPAGENG